MKTDCTDASIECLLPREATTVQKTGERGTASAAKRINGTENRRERERGTASAAKRINDTRKNVRLREKHKQHYKREKQACSVWHVVHKL